MKGVEPLSERPDRAEGTLVEGEDQVRVVAIGQDHPDSVGQVKTQVTVRRAYLMGSLQIRQSKLRQPVLAAGDTSEQRMADRESAGRPRSRCAR